MSRMSVFSAPFLLGFDTFEERIDRLNKLADSYPPYNIERLGIKDGSEKFVISIAVAGFAQNDLEIMLEDNQLVVKGRQTEHQDRHFLHQGIAARDFQRTFLLADGMQIDGATLESGMLIIETIRPRPQRQSRAIKILVKE